MTYTTYGVTRTFLGKTYSNSGFSSHEEALEAVHRAAFENGDWRPRALRQKWWQFWRPVEHTELEKMFSGEDGRHGSGTGDAPVKCCPADEGGCGSLVHASVRQCDAPEKIWARPDPATVYMDGSSPVMARDREFSRSTEYVRADIAERQIAEMRAKIDVQRESKEYAQRCCEAAEADRDRLAADLERKVAVAKEALHRAHDAFDTIAECAENYIHSPGQMTNRSTAKYGMSVIDTALASLEDRA